MPPPIFLNLWLQYVGAAAEKQPTGYGVCRLTRRHVEEWARGLPIEITPFKVRALKEIDALMIEATREWEAERKAEKQNATR